jgi:hypothetical protein
MTEFLTYVFVYLPLILIGIVIAIIMCGFGAIILLVKFEDFIIMRNIAKYDNDSAKSNRVNFDNKPGMREKKKFDLSSSQTAFIDDDDDFKIEYTDDYVYDYNGIPVNPGYELSGEQDMLEDEERYHGMDYGFLEDDEDD